eukprot:scaffold12670_cov119-Isochrysis_galbana.AAC.4
MMRGPDTVTWGHHTRARQSQIQVRMTLLIHPHGRAEGGAVHSVARERVSSGWAMEGRIAGQRPRRRKRRIGGGQRTRC